MVGFGTGGIKPCVATFGGDQFKMPEQKSQSELFFSIFYWAVNLGSFLSMIITPIIRYRVELSLVTAVLRDSYKDIT